MAVPIANYLATGRLPRKMGSGMAMMVPYELYDTADGQVFIAAANDRLFARICEALGCPELPRDVRFADNPSRVGHREALHGTRCTALAWGSICSTSAMPWATVLAVPPTSWMLKVCKVLPSCKPLRVSQVLIWLASQPSPTMITPAKLGWVA